MEEIKSKPKLKVVLIKKKAVVEEKKEEPKEVVEEKKAEEPKEKNIFNRRKNKIYNLCLTANNKAKLSKKMFEEAKTPEDLQYAAVMRGLAEGIIYAARASQYEIRGNVDEGWKFIGLKEKFKKEDSIQTEETTEKN